MNDVLSEDGEDFQLLMLPASSEFLNYMIRNPTVIRIYEYDPNPISAAVINVEFYSVQLRGEEFMML